MKKKICIICYYFPPCSSIASLRPYSWAKELSKRGYEITVFTRHWKGDEKNWNDYLIDSDIDEVKMDEEGFEVFSLPFKAGFSNKYVNRIFNKIHHLFLFLSGIFNIEINTLQWFNLIDSKIELNSYDLLIVSAPPYNLINLAHKIKEKYDLPFVADFRDFDNHSLLGGGKNVDFKNEILYKLKAYHMNRICQKAFLVSAVNRQILEVFSNKKEDKVIILNGYEGELFAALEATESQDFFVISVIGSIYPQQDIQLFINGFKKFMEGGNRKVLLNFIGLDVIPDVSKLIRKQLPENFVRITGRLPREEALTIGKSSHVLFYPAWKGYKGVYSGKIFEYLGFKKNILIAPGDNDVIEELIRETNAGKVENSIDEINNTLLAWYNEWYKNRTLKFHGNERSSLYTREKQAAKLINQIEKMA